MRWRDLVLALALIAMETYGWAAPVVVAFQIASAQGLGRVLGVTFGLLLLAFATGQGMQRTTLSMVWQRAIAVVVALAGWGVLAIGLGAPLWRIDWWTGLLDRQSNMGTERAVAFALVAGGIALWWRGMHLAQSRRDFDSVWFAFVLGLVVIAGSSVAAVIAGVVAAVEALVLPFFVFGLVALALARLEQVGYGKGLTGGYWLIVLATMVMAVLAVGGWVETLWGAERAMLPGSFSLPFAAFWSELLYRVFMLLFLPVEFLINLLRSLSLRPIPSFREGLSGFVEGLQDQVTNRTLVPEVALVVAKVFLVVGGILVVLLLLGLAFRRRWREGHRAGAEERASIWSPDLFLSDLTGFLQRLLEAQRRRGPQRASEVDRWAHGSWEVQALFSLYRELLATAERRGRSRLSWETPFEFQAALETELGWTEATEITAAFVQARYGFIAPSREEVLRLRRLWEVTVR